MRPYGIDAKLFDLFLHRFSVSRRAATESEARGARVDLSNIITRRRVYRDARDRAVRTSHVDGFQRPTTGPENCSMV